MTKKEQFGEYSAYDTKAGIRFMKDGKLTSAKNVPTDVVEILTNRLTGTRSRVETSSRVELSDEQKAQLRAESLKVKPELQMTPEEIADRTPIGNENFDEPTEDVMQQVESMLDSNGNEPLPRPDDNIRPDSADFLEQVSIHTAQLEDIAQALYDRFGIYTVYLRALPRGDEVNPLTAQPFTKYHLGIAYQAAIYAESQGILDLNHEFQRVQLDQGRAASENFRTDPVNHTLADARRANDFNFRTSVRGTQDAPTTRIEHIKGEDGIVRAVQVEISHDEINKNLNGTRQRYDNDEDDIIVEPPIMGTTPIIRPNW